MCRIFWPGPIRDPVERFSNNSNIRPSAFTQKPASAPLQENLHKDESVLQNKSTLKEELAENDIILPEESVPKTNSALADKHIPVQIVPIAAVVDVIVHTAQAKEPSSCDATLKKLVDRYFEPHMERGITKETIKNALFDHELGGDRESISHVQDVKDCQANWARPIPFVYRGHSEKESAQIYDSLPILTITKCDSRASIPIVQWFSDRDGGLDEWGDRTEEFIRNSQPSTLKAPAEGKRCTDIDASNYREMGRSKIVLLGKQYPELLHARMSVYNNFNHVFANDTDGLTSSETMSSCEQAKRFKYVVYAEGACGWADRLKTLMLYNSTILMQTTTCHEYYMDLMKPYEHYIPVKANHDDLVEKIQWARNHDVEATKMAQKALEVGVTYLTPDKMRCYMNLLFDKYRELMRYVPSKKLLVQKYTGSI